MKAPLPSPALPSPALSSPALASPALPSPALASGPLLSRPLLWSTAAITALALFTSLLGLLATWPYAAAAPSWALQARGQDLGNLLALVCLVAGATRAARGSLRGLQVWAGALLYLGYALVIYAMTVPFGPLFLPYVAVLGLSCYALGFALPRAPRPTLAAGPARVAGWLLSVVAGLFALLWFASIVGGLRTGTVPPELAETGLPANPVHVLDLALVLPGMALTAALARRGSATARLLLAPWLVFTALMGASIVATLLASGVLAPTLAMSVVTLAGIAGATTVLTTTSPVEGRN